MGGTGSGRKYYFGAKDTTEDYRSIDVRRWNRDGLLTPGQSFGWQWSRNDEKVASIQCRTESNRVTLTYSHRTRGEDVWKHETYPVYLDWTGCNLGGKRPWFRCPALGCGRRVAILYGGAIFACRHCHQLVYASQREILDNRIMRKADKIRERLEWEPGILNDCGWKPKGMHWSTYEKLTALHDEIVRTSLIRMTAQFNLNGNQEL